MEDATVTRTAAPDGATAWVVSGYQTVRQLLGDPRLSLSKAHAKEWKGFSLPPMLDANLLNMDPPDHTRIRKVIGTAFTARRVAALRPGIERTADELIDAIEPAGEADLIAAYAAPLPVSVICDLLGVPDDARPDFRQWTNTILEFGDPRAVGAAVKAIVKYLGELIGAKRDQRGSDLLSALVTARDDRREISEEELISLAFVLLFAGYENSVNVIGNATVVLLRHPEQLLALRRNPALLEPAVEELLRFDPPTPLAMRRFPLEDLSIGDTTIPAGDAVLLDIAGSGRDPKRFTDPGRLDPHRADNAHLAFGYGIHYCVGAPLARLEATIALGTLLRRLPRLALAVQMDELTWRPSTRTHGLASLPVRW